MQSNSHDLKNETPSLEISAENKLKKSAKVDKEYFKNKTNNKNGAFSTNLNHNNFNQRNNEKNQNSGRNSDFEWRRKNFTTLDSRQSTVVEEDNARSGLATVDFKINNENTTRTDGGLQGSDRSDNLGEVSTNKLRNESFRQGKTNYSRKNNCFSKSSQRLNEGIYETNVGTAQNQTSRLKEYNIRNNNDLSNDNLSQRNLLNLQNENFQLRRNNNYQNNNYFQKNSEKFNEGDFQINDKNDRNQTSRSNEYNIRNNNDLGNENLNQINTKNLQNESFQLRKNNNYKKNNYFPKNDAKFNEGDFKINDENDRNENLRSNENYLHNNYRRKDCKNNKFDRNQLNQRNEGNKTFQRNDYYKRNGSKNNDFYYNSNDNIKAIKINNEIKIKEKTSIDLSKLDQREYLIHELNLNRYECLICMSVLDKNDATWNCEHCYHIFHLKCITKWSQSSVDKNENSEEETHWRCPTCQTNHLKSEELFYTCFCKKEFNPLFKRGTIAHSCGDVCGKKNESVNNNAKCLHLCSLQCHPGPCPQCEASVTRSCHCRRTRITAKCIADELQFTCQSICDQLLQCQLHKCEKQCHVDDGHACSKIIEQSCFCGNSTRDILCGSKDSESLRYCCEEVCRRKKTCDNHTCESLCHEDDCGQCEKLPNKIKNCFCGKKTLEELFVERVSCLDDIPSCGEICEKVLINCGHKCNEICHEGECKPCTGTMLSKCRCKSTQLTVDCVSEECSRLCKQRCKLKLLCNRHRCERQCCAEEVHLCLATCNRMLSCKKHRCERECGHPGRCPSCPNVSFEELFCECGESFTLPPIACNQSPPSCRLLCSREHGCSHEVRHNCHTESTCPPCTELVNKACPGGHREYTNVPCFRAVATCGLRCGKSLPSCTHSCAKVCHGGDCVEVGEKCLQSCNKLRSECSHPCEATCHEGSCDDVMDKCTNQLVLTCECTLRSCRITCHKLENIKFLLRCESSDISADIIYKDDKVFMTCDNDCKRAARNYKLAQVFNIEVPLGVLYTYYPDSIKDFGFKHKNYVVHIQNILINIQNGFNNHKNATTTEMICPVSYEESQFVQRYTTCFKMQSVCGTDKRGRQYVCIEARRGMTQVPRPLLTEVLREKYPHLFVEKVQNTVQVLTTAPGTTLSFADRLKLKK